MGTSISSMIGFDVVRIFGVLFYIGGFALGSVVLWLLYYRWYSWRDSRWLKRVQRSRERGEQQPQAQVSEA